MMVVQQLEQEAVVVVELVQLVVHLLVQELQELVVQVQHLQ